MTPTQEQLDIVAAARDTSDNLLINALAGAAKTTTLVLIAEALKGTRTLCLAFNKKIAVEMQERLPDHCDSLTLNSLGHRVWSEVLGRRLHIDANKINTLLVGYIETLHDPDEKSAVWDEFSELVRAVSFGKQCGYIPDGYGRRGKPLMSDEEFRNHYDMEFSDFHWNIVREISWRSLNLAWDGVLDFDDQILMPTLFPAVFPRYPLVLVDEAQDLSALNHATLRKLVVKRLIAVGDPCQAIYGFRGAHEESMDLLRETFSMKEYTLSISFRCPKKVVEAARWRAPQMQYPEWALEGEVTSIQPWAVDDIPQNAAIICRNNAPLFSLAIRLLKHGRYAQILGNDVGRGLLKIIKKLGPKKMPREALLTAIDQWAAQMKQKSRNPGLVDDKAECLRIFARQGKTLGDALAYAEHVFSCEGPIKLMTGHKSKGLEFDDVFILDRNLLADKGQDRNLRYVMITRAKKRLTYIDSDQFLEPDMDH